MKTLTKISVKTVAMLTLGVMVAGSAIAKGGDGNKGKNKQCDGEKGPKFGEFAGKDMPGKGRSGHGKKGNSKRKGGEGRRNKGGEE